jgi:hypothetical protein
MNGRQAFGMIEGMYDVQVARDAARPCHSRLREAWGVEGRRALLKFMVELWDRADELERHGSSWVSPRPRTTAWRSPWQAGQIIRRELTPSTRTRPRGEQLAGQKGAGTKHLRGCYYTYQPGPSPSPLGRSRAALGPALTGGAFFYFGTRPAARASLRTASPAAPQKLSGPRSAFWFSRTVPPRRYGGSGAIENSKTWPLVWWVAVAYPPSILTPKSLIGDVLLARLCGGQLSMGAPGGGQPRGVLGQNILDGTSL